MPRIPLSGQRKPQTEGRGGNERNEREIQEMEEKWWRERGEVGRD